jgi:hypothetical protein
LVDLGFGAYFAHRGIAEATPGEDFHRCHQQAVTACIIARGFGHVLNACLKRLIGTIVLNERLNVK